MGLIDWIIQNRAALHYIPFLGAIVGQRTTDKPNLIRITENALTAIAAAALVMWRNDSLQDYKLDQMQRQITTMANQAQERHEETSEKLLALNIAIAEHMARSDQTPAAPKASPHHSRN
jgi:hypothetical protein